MIVIVEERLLRFADIQIGRNHIAAVRKLEADGQQFFLVRNVPGGLKPGSGQQGEIGLPG
ncbi:hypothetical protein D3C87_2205320 [compost metagenome]